MSQAPRHLTTGEGSILLHIARAAIANDLGVRTPMPSHRGETALMQPGASFVAIYSGAKRLAQIGTVEPYRPLAEDVAENARAAAFSDPRIPPLKADDLDKVLLEVSVLSAIERLDTSLPEVDVLETLRPGIDGLVIRQGRHHATFLPHVWSEYKKPGDFLRHLKRKAQLDESAWGDSLHLGRYEVQSWRETARG